jgi:hypothetical protein
MESSATGADREVADYGYADPVPELGGDVDPLPLVLGGGCFNWRASEF